MGPSERVPLRLEWTPEVMPIKQYSYKMDTLEGVLLLRKDTVGIFYNASQLDLKVLYFDFFFFVGDFLEGKAVIILKSKF